MKGRMPAKAKLSITLSADLVERIDEEVRQTPGANRSSVIEQWLRSASRDVAAAMLREETVRYYRSLSEEEREEDEAIASASSEKARRVRYD